MPELNIYFFGLICHVDQNNNDGNKTADFAAVVRAGSHRPLILFGPTAADIYELESNVTFSAVEPAAINRSHFDRAVPKLRSILGGVLAIDPGDVWRVDYPRGDRSRAELSVADTYAYLGIHRSKATRHTRRLEGPVARIVRLRVPLDDETITIRFTGSTADGSTVTSKTIPSDSCVLIANIEDTYLFDAGVDLDLIGRELNEVACEMADERWSSLARRLSTAGQNLTLAARSLAKTQPNHFEYYSMLVAGGDTVVAEEGRLVQKTAPSLACTWIDDFIGTIDRRYFPLGASRPECGNTNWP